MANSPQDHVHRLIRSMSPAEKRYFKLHTSRHVVAGHSNHQELFDAIASMAEYDEVKLRNRFADAAFMRRFAISKRRLYEAVLASLDAFHTESSIENKLRRMLHHVEILHRRALYADASKALHGARAFAQEHHKHALLLQIAEWERRMMERGNYAGVTEAHLAERSNSVAGIAEQWQEVDQLWQAKSDVFLVIYRSGQTACEADQVELEKLAAHPLLGANAKLHGPRARFLHHHVRSALAYASNDLAACEKQLSDCAEVLRKETGAFKEEPDLLLGVMGNLANVRMRLGRQQEAIDGFKEFRKIPLLLANAPSPDLEMKLFVMGTSLELSVRTTKGEFAAAMEQLTQVEEGLAKFGARVSAVRRAELALHAAYACFGAGANEMALRWCNRLLNEKGIEAHTEIYALGRMMNLAVLIELDKEDLITYVVRNTQRYLKQHGHPFAMEPLLLEHALTLEKAKSTKEEKRNWSTLAASLAETAKDHREAGILDHFDVIAWARSKSEGRVFGDLVGEKWRANAIHGGGPSAKGNSKRAA